MREVAIYQPMNSGVDEKTLVVNITDSGNLGFRTKGFLFMLDRTRAIELMATLDVLISDYDGEDL